MRTGLHDPSAVHDENAVRILHRGDTLGDDDLCGIRKLILKCLTDQGIGLCVDRRGGIVEDQDLRLL